MVVRVIAKVFQDDTGVYAELPVLVDHSQEVIKPLLEYTLVLKREGRSQSTINNLIKSVHLMLEYLEANISSFDDPKTLFEVFASRLYTGTVDDQGYDPSGLYWLPLSQQSARLYIGALTQFTDWLANQYGVDTMNPMVEADSYIQRLNYAAWFRKNQHDFLGHIKDKYIHQTARYARNVRAKSSLSQKTTEALAFPEAYFEDFYLKGIGGAKDCRVAIRDQLIVLLMHGGGLRESEALHLWLDDILMDTSDPASVKVCIQHPEEGIAPHGWTSRNGSSNRAAYLREVFNLAPRTDKAKEQYVGWKSKSLDSLEVYWFPREYGHVFTRLWSLYLRLLSTVDKELRHHPYAFISFRKEALGQPYTLNAFNYNYCRAVKRIGLQPSKAEGLSPHSHRHSYGRRLAQAEVHPRVIQKALHHSALDGQKPYTAPSYEEVTQALNEATNQLAQKIKTQRTPDTMTNWQALVQYGFNDIDPDGLFTGLSPVLR